MGRETRGMQDDDVTNPGMLGVLEGGGLWARKAGTAGRACADCHGDARASMKGVAARYPAFDATLKRPVNLEQRINSCRTDRQQAPALAYESRELLALTAFVARQSRGLPIDIAVDGRVQPFLDNGRAAFYRRQGQLNRSCSHRHHTIWRKRLTGNAIPQGHPTGYPGYRLPRQSPGTPPRPPRHCPVGMRPEPSEKGPLRPA